MMAAIMYMRFRDALPDEQALRKKMRLNATLSSIHCGPVAPTFPCTMCDAHYHRAKDATWCCKKEKKRARSNE